VAGHLFLLLLRFVGI